MAAEFEQVTWDQRTQECCRQVVRWAIEEDLGRECDWTTVALVPPEQMGQAQLVVRASGRLAGLPAVPVVLEEFDQKLQWIPQVEEGTLLQPGTVIGHLRGPAWTMLVAERTLLNLLGRLSGVATLTHRFVQAVSGTGVRIYDTRKTTPGWRRLEKYAVAVGGGYNHRLGLHRAVLIKDNHLALWLSRGQSPARAVEQVRRFLQQASLPEEKRNLVVEIEVDRLDQLPEVLRARPDVVLLDNMSLEQLRQAVQMRGRLAPSVVLEASGGITLENVRQVALTGVDRISVGALTHQATWLDFSLEWQG